MTFLSFLKQKQLYSIYKHHRPPATNNNMQTSPSSIGPITSLTLGGGGIGLVWGKSTKQESIATLRKAVHHHHINFLDMAPMYGKNRAAEHFVGEAFNGKLPSNVQVLTKVYCGNRTAQQIQLKVRDSLMKSLKAMRLSKVNVLICHSNLVPNDWKSPFPDNDTATRWDAYVNGFIPICQQLIQEGLIDSFGITGIGGKFFLFR